MGVTDCAYRLLHGTREGAAWGHCPSTLPLLWMVRRERGEEASPGSG
jgi:hypothetical protein